MSKQKKKNSQKLQSSPGLAPAAAVKQVARVLPAVEIVSKAARSDMRTVVSRAPTAFITLVAEMAEEGGDVADVLRFDATATRDALTQVAQLRAGVTAARAVLRYLQQETLVLASGIAQRALSATTSLEAFVRTPEGRTLAAKAGDLRAAQRKGRRLLGKQAKDAGNVTTPINGADAKPATVAATSS